MTTRHWILASYDEPFSGTPTFPALFLDIPAGGIMKKILVNEHVIRAVATGEGFQAVGPIWLLQGVQFESGPYGTRQLFKRGVVLRSNFVTLYDAGTLRRIYTQWTWGDDTILEINQQVSYGLASGPGFRVSYRSSLNPFPDTPVTYQGRAQCHFRVLYETTP